MRFLNYCFFSPLRGRSLAQSSTRDGSEEGIHPQGLSSFFVVSVSRGRLQQCSSSAPARHGTECECVTASGPTAPWPGGGTPPRPPPWEAPGDASLGDCSSLQPPVARGPRKNQHRSRRPTPDKWRAVGGSKPLRRSTWTRHFPGPSRQDGGFRLWGQTDGRGGAGCHVASRRSGEDAG